MAKGTRFGREAQEQAWQSAEVDALYRLAAAGVRVPRPYNFHEGVLLMELVADEEGNAAPRLNDVELTPEIAVDLHERLIREVVRMLAAGVVHGDLSEFNILARRRRARDHRPAAGGGRGGQQPRAAHAGARRGQPAPLLRAVRAGAPRHRLRQGDLGAVRVGHAAPGHAAHRAVRARRDARSTSKASCARSTTRGSRKPPGSRA